MGSLPPANNSFLELAKIKRDSVSQLIPNEWRLPLPLPTTKAQKDVTGSYVEQYLKPWEIQITQADAVKIVEQTTSGKWTATEVVLAFCHRAALAHQLVCLWNIVALESI
jgi:amidase